MAKGKRKVCVADCETDPFKKGRAELRPFLWGFYDGESYEQFEKTEDFIAHVRELNVICYAHNGGKFDWHFILPYLEPWESVMIINGRLARFKIGLCEFRDSYNILPVPLSAWAKDDMDYSIMEADVRHDPRNWQKIVRYLYHDCLYLYEMVTKFISEYGAAMTLAGCAMKTWESMTETKAPQSDRAYYQKMSPYYYGGRVQCFQSGEREEDFKVIDINSAYPRAMLEQHPIDVCPMEMKTHPALLIDKWMHRAPGLVFAEIDAVSSGALPFRGPDGSLFFPDDGRVRTYRVTGWEIKTGLETGTLKIKRVRAGYRFLKSISFQDYVDHFYGKRLTAKAEAKRCWDQGDEEGWKSAKRADMFAKLLLNSLYGKFGSDYENYKKFVPIPEEYMPLVGLQVEDAQTIELAGATLADFRNTGMLGPWALIERDLSEREMRYYNVATAASITGFVRAYLWDAITKCEGVIYCDTDSIACAKVGDAIPIGNKLGEWEMEGEFESWAIGGRKLYAFRRKAGTFDPKTAKPYKLATKGCRLGAEEVIEIARGGEIDYVPEAPTFSVHREPAIVKRKIRAVNKTLA